jgi:hypothetical protein
LIAKTNYCTDDFFKLRRFPVSDIALHRSRPASGQAFHEANRPGDDIFAKPDA